jgi:hypothetical protein
MELPKSPSNSHTLSLGLRIGKCGELTSKEFIKITHRTEAGCVRPDLTGVEAR